MVRNSLIQWYRFLQGMEVSLQTRCWWVEQRRQQAAIYIDIDAYRPACGLSTVFPLVFLRLPPFFSHIPRFVCCLDTRRHCLSICAILCNVWQRFAMYPGTGLIGVYSCSYPWNVALVFPQDESRMLAHHIGVACVVCCRPPDKHGRASTADFFLTLLRCLLVPARFSTSSLLMM